MVLADQCGLPDGITLVVGVSGGADSICLLDLLSHMNYRLVVCHFDHGLRPESAAEARYVERIAIELGLEFILGKGDVIAFCKKERLSIEEGARLSRYQFLFRAARQVSAFAVAVAHTGDDQVETVLMHLLRGSGLAGLRGMKHRTIFPEWDAAIPLVRPLLGVYRSEVLQYCLKHGLQPVEDQTNQDVTYFRNRLRHELIPALETYNPQIKPALLRMSSTLAADEEILEKAAIVAWGDCIQREGPGWISMSKDAFESQEVGLQRRILRHAIDQLRPGLRNVDFEAIERGRGLVISSRGAGQVELTAGLRLYKTRKLLFIASHEDQLPTEDVPQMHQADPVLLEIPGRVELANGWIIECEVVNDATNRRFGNLPDTYQAWLDADYIESPLVVRRPKPGDKLQPLGMQGHSVILADLWINKGIPRFQRKNWPLVMDKQAILWVPGVLTSELGKIVETTRNILHLRCNNYS